MRDNNTENHVEKNRNDSVEILIAEDSPTQAETLKFLLEKKNYLVFVAYNGREALEMIHKRKPAIVISDIVMPEMDGYELCRQIKENENLRDIPVILLTVLSDPKDVIKGLEVGADNFFSKPYDEEYLVARIQYLLANRILHTREKMEMGIKIFFCEQEYYITAERQQILNLLLSTYGTAVQKNLELQKIHEELLARERQMTAIAELGQAAFSGIDLDTLMDEAVSLISHTLGAEYCGIFELMPDGENALLRTGIGWNKAAAHRAALAVGPETLAGFTLRSGEPLIIENMNEETRFHDILLLKHGVLSGISIVLGDSGEPFGIIGTFTTRLQKYTLNEISFFESVSTLLSEVIERKHAEDELRHARDELEIRVQERTSELAKTNEALKAEITEHKRLVDELKDSEERYRRLFEVSKDGLFLLDKLTGHIIAVNQSGMEIVSISREEILGKSLLDIGLFKDNVLLQDTLHKLKKNGFVRCGDILIETKGRESIDAEMFIINRTSVIQCNVRDITERRKAEEMRIEKERLEYASIAKNEFLASMSHELRTPLNAIIGFSELMNMGLAGKLSEKQKKYVSNISLSGNFLLTLINDILDMSKIEAGKIELNIEKTHISTNIEDSIILIKEKASKQNIKIIKEIDPCIEFIEADKQRFKQILFNLLSNAIKFSKEEGGKVTISVTKVDEMAQISVSDTGIGIKPENICKLFQKFEQLEKSISAKYGGTGLGLSITKQLVELHGGKIWAESKYGEGSCFTFLLPLKAKNGEYS